MASIKADCAAKKVLLLNDFVPEPSGTLLDLYEVESGRLILITEVLKDAITYAFFDAHSRQKIDRQSRFDSENGKTEYIEVDSNNKGISTVSVSVETGFESIEETVINGKNVVYKNRRERYPKNEIPDLRERYTMFLRQWQENRLRLESFVNTFNNVDLEGKVSLLLGLFRKEWRNRSQLGFEKPELFLGKELILELDKDPHFRKALRKVLELEQSTFDYDVSLTYQNILNF